MSRGGFLSAFPFCALSETLWPSGNTSVVTTLSGYLFLGTRPLTYYLATKMYGLSHFPT